MKKIQLSRSVSLPINVITQRLAALGISGSGKTYAVMKLVEEVLEAKGQVIVIDTMGNWWGLRLAANGKGKGLPIPIFGGDRADVPLSAGQGKQTAELAARSKASMILDVSDFVDDELYQFIRAFSTAFLRVKKTHRSPVLVVWEECQECVPEISKDKEAHKMRQEVVRLIKKGRNHGVGTLLISQRAAAVSKEALNQVETLFAFRTGGTQDRTAISDWLTKKAREKTDLIEELPSLPTGTCYIYSPAWLGMFEKVTVGKRWTFDSSATPDFDDFQEAGALSPVDLAKFKKEIGATLEKAKESDPVHLRTQLAQLKAQLHEMTVERDRQIGESKRISTAKAIERPIIKERDLARVEKLADKLGTRLLDVKETLGLELVKLRTALRDNANRVVRDAPQPKVLGPIRGRVIVVPGTPAQKIRPTRPAVVPKPGIDVRGLGKCEREILRALAVRRPQALERAQMAVLAGYSASGGGFNNGLSALRSAGLIESLGDLTQLTAAGEAWAEQQGITPIHDAAGLFDLWAQPGRLAPKNAVVLRTVIEAGTDGLTKAELAERVNMDPSGGGFNNYLSKLNSTNLIKKNGDRIRAVDLLLGA